MIWLVVVFVMLWPIADAVHYGLEPRRNDERMRRKRLAQRLLPEEKRGRRWEGYTKRTAWGRRYL